MKWTMEQMADQTGRVAIVTGANTGIGYEAAKALAGAGAEVLLGVRSPEKGEAAVARILADHPRAKARAAKLDLADLGSVGAFAEAYRVECGRLDLLVNNAGVMMPKERTETVDGFELQFGVNHLGHFALTGHLLDLLFQREGARVVTVSSGAHRMADFDLKDLNWKRRPYRRVPSYGQSKLANLLFTFELQRRLSEAGSATIAVAAHPGWTATDLQRHTPTFRALNPIFAMKPWQGALSTLLAATGPEVAGGDYYGPHGMREMRGYPVKVGVSAAARDGDTARCLWELSEEMTGVRYSLPEPLQTRG